MGLDFITNPNNYNHNKVYEVSGVVSSVTRFNKKNSTNSKIQNVYFCHLKKMLL